MVKRKKAKTKTKAKRKVKAKKKPVRKVSAKGAAPAGGQGSASGGKKAKGPKVIGRIEHFFGKISVAALKLKSPLKVGDVIHIKGHTTGFTQKIDSMQIEHRDVAAAKKGQDVGFKVRDKVREGDTVFLGPEEKVAEAKR